MYHVISNDGTKISVEDTNPNSEKVIVLVHGWPLNKKMFEYQKSVLNDYGYRVVSLDLRGFGDSQVTDNGYQYDQLADDLYAVIEQLNVRTVSLLGFSMGGAVVTHYMAKYNNDMVDKLILVGAAVPSFTISKENPYGMTPTSVNQLINQAYHDRPKMCADFGAKVFAQHHSQEFLNWFQTICEQGSGIGTIQTAISLRNENIFSDLSKIKVPTAIFHGKLDQICPYPLAIIQHEQIPNSELYSFEYSGHGVFYDELELFNQILINFLEKK